jgi:protein-S-isoprenylcysteine O-methyltransferase Ste14
MNTSVSYSQIARRIRVPLGFVFAAIYLWLAHPTWSSIIAGCLVAAPGIWLRALAAGHVKKNSELTTTGPYGYTRNPLYLGSLIIATGFGVASQSVWVAVGIIVLFLAIYIPVIRSEEQFLRTTFTDFNEYSRRVPRLLPRLLAPERFPAGIFSRELYLKHREYNALVGSLLMMLALVAKVLFTSRFWSFPSGS